MNKENSGFNTISIADIGALSQISLDVEESLRTNRMLVSSDQLRKFMLYPNGNYLSQACIESRRVLGQEEGGMPALSPDGLPLIYGLSGDFFNREYFFQIGNGTRYKTKISAGEFLLYLIGFSEGKPVVLAQQIMYSMDADAYPSMWEHSRTRTNFLLHGEKIVQQGPVKKAFIRDDGSIAFFTMTTVENRYESWSWKAGELSEATETFKPKDETSSHSIQGVEIVFTEARSFKFGHQALLNGEARTLPFKRMLDVRKLGQELWIVYTNGRSYDVKFQIAPLANLVEYLQKNPEPKRGREDFRYMTDFREVATYHNRYDGGLTRLSENVFAYRARVFQTTNHYSSGSSMFWTTKPVNSHKEAYLPDATELVEEQGKFYYYSLVGKHLLKFEL